MSAKAVAGAALLFVGVFAGATLLLPAKPQPATAEEVPKPPAARPDPKPDPKPEPEPEPKPVEKPRAKNPVVARWAVPGAVVDGRPDGAANSPHSVAVNDAGTRVLVQTSRFVDVWESGRAACVRVQLKRLNAAFVAPDAARFYMVNDDPKQLETYDHTGNRVAVWNPPLKKGWNQRFDFTGFNPTTSQLTIGVHYTAADGFYTVAPETGQGRLAVPFANGGDVFSCRKLFPQADGRYLVHYEPEAGVKRAPGLYAVAGDGTFRPGPGIPPDAKEFGHIREIALSADGRYAALIGGRVLKVWDTRDGSAVLTWKMDYYYPYACAFVRGRLMVAAGSDYEKWNTQGGALMSVSAMPVLLQLYDVKTLALVSEFRPGKYELPCRAVAFSPDGSKLALADDKKVALVDAEVAFGLGK